jgi:hypothetical protein
MRTTFWHRLSLVKVVPVDIDVTHDTLWQVKA